MLLLEKITLKLTRPPASLANNFERGTMLELIQENARARGSALNDLLSYFFEFFAEV
jgi:hypothetical protein